MNQPLWRVNLLSAGMIISPNPNSIATAENFGMDLSALMAAGIIPALVGLAGTVIICTLLSGKGRKKMTHRKSIL